MRARVSEPSLGLGRVRVCLVTVFSAAFRTGEIEDVSIPIYTSLGNANLELLHTR